LDERDPGGRRRPTRAVGGVHWKGLTLTEAPSCVTSAWSQEYVPWAGGRQDDGQQQGGSGVHTYDWITPAQAATRLGTAIRDVYRMVDGGRLPAYRIGGEIRLLAHEVEDYARRTPPG
jgi:excisionase family DNA binding protein